MSDKRDGIVPYKGIPSLRIEQHRHPAWTTTVYVIPRVALNSNRINIDKLNNNSIYILQQRDSNNLTTQLYVGQASLRNNGQASLARLREHLKDRLADKWDCAFVFTSILQDKYGWNPTILDLLENNLKTYIETEASCRCLNRNTPTKGSIAGPEIEEIVSNIKVYLHYLMPDIFEIVEEGTDENLIEKKEVSLIVTDLQDDVFGTCDITTPAPTVKAMVDMLPKELFNSRTRFFDPACKAGEFLYEIYSRLMDSEDLVTKYRDANKRSLHILEDQLFGVAISDISYKSTCELLYGDTKKRNIRQVKNYEYQIREAFSRGYKHGVAKTKDLIFNTIFKDIFNTTGQENIQDMKFDVVIGNPPYSDSETRGTTGSGNALYPQFMTMASAIGTYSSLIVPSGWMIQYPMGVRHEIIDELRKNKHIVELHDFADATKVFVGVSIPAGVCYYLMDTTKIYNTCIHKVTPEKGESYVIDNLPLYNEEAGVCFRDKYILSISSKIWGKQPNLKSFADTCAGVKAHFGGGQYWFGSTWNEYSSFKTEEYNII